MSTPQQGTVNTANNAAVPWANAQLIDPNPPISPEQKLINDGMSKDFDPTHPLAASGFAGILTIDMILRLITKVVGSLQNSAVIKSDNVAKVLVPWQNAITDEMNKIHVFTRGKDSTDISGNSKDSGKDTKMSNARDDMNRVLANNTETLRNDRSQITDEIKLQQTNLQSLNDTITAATSLFNTLIGKLSDINRSLYR